MMNNDRPTKLLWIDLEMTGLEPETDRILEVAAIVTDFSFKDIDTFSAVVRQPEAVLDRSNDWVKEQFTANGLFDRVRKDGQPEEMVVKDFTAFIDKHFEVPAILAGNSIHQDRRFIRKWWPSVEKKLHYRMLDVSSFKVLMRGRYAVEIQKSEAHRALDDIRESISELEFYIEPCEDIWRKLSQ